MFCQSCGTNVADGTAFCTSCGRPIVGYSVGQASGGAAAMAVPTANAYSSGAVSYAGFWLRFVAIILDSIILGIPGAIVYFSLIASALPTIVNNQNNPGLIVAAILPRVFFLIILALIGHWIYWALMESSSWQATLGKKALGLYVTDLEGNRVSFGKASGRYWAGRGPALVPLLGGLYYLVDCICAGFTERKQALHDMIAGCLVLRKS